VPLSPDELTDAMVRKLRETFGLIPVGVVSEFCGVEIDAAAGWFGRKRPLGGLSTLRLMYLLLAAGVKLPEHDEIRDTYPLGEYIGRLLAFGVLTMDEVSEFSGKVRDGAIFRAARAEGTLAECSYTLAELKATYQEELFAKAEALMEKLPGQPAEVEEEKPSGEVPVMSRPAVGGLVSGDPEDDYLAALAAMIAAMHPEVVRAQALTPERRARLRTLIGEQTLFAVSTGLNRLGSLRAYEERGSD
jgi:hypothetical protein